MHYTEASDTVVLDFQTVWIRELPLLLILLGDRQPSSSQVLTYFTFWASLTW